MILKVKNQKVPFLLLISIPIGVVKYFSCNWPIADSILGKISHWFKNFLLLGI